MYDHEGVMVFPPDDYMMDKLMQWADIVITHLDYTKLTIQEAKKWGKPVFFLSHNNTLYPSVRDGEGDIRVIHNSTWIAADNVYQWPTFVFPPACDEWYKLEMKPEEQKFITLCNLSNNKGSDYFYSWAKKLPQYQFLGVKGSYENQHIVRLPNVTIQENTPDIREVYRKTKILVVPSHYESWGRVASEAILNGIPVIANPTEGLKENLSYAGLFVARKDSARMIETISQLMEDEDFYKKQSELCKKRAAEQVPDWDGLMNFLSV